MIKTYKVAVVTGASCGIGAAVARRLVQQGIKLILIARREDKLSQLAQELRVYAACHVIACDVCDHAKLQAALSVLPPEFSAVDILINNAGIPLGLEPAQNTLWQDWQQMIATNCTALAFITHLLLPSMVARNCGHIVNLSSIAGSYPYYGGNVYGATKAFVSQLSRNLKADLLGTAVRVTNIEPGMVGGTEFSQVRFKGDERSAENVYKGADPLLPESVAECVAWAIAQPAYVNINRIELMPVCQAPNGLAVHRNSSVKNILA